MDKRYTLGDSFYPQNTITLGTFMNDDTSKVKLIEIPKTNLRRSSSTLSLRSYTGTLSNNKKTTMVKKIKGFVLKFMPSQKI